MDSSQIANSEKDKHDKENLSESFNIIRFFAKYRGSQQYEEQKMQLLVELLKYVKQIQESNKAHLEKYATDAVINVQRVFLTDQKASIRVHALKFFRFILETPQIADLYNQKNLPLLIARSLERETKQERTQQNMQQSQIGQQQIQEVQQALKLLTKWIDVSPKNLSKFLANSLVAFTEQCEESLKKPAVELIRKLALYHPELCAWCGGVKMLIESIVDPNVQDISESIVYTLLYLMNDPRLRCRIKVYLDLSKIFAIFTDIDYQNEQQKEKGKVDQAHFDAQVKLAKKALILIMKSWIGLIYLGNEKIALRSIIQSLRQPIKPNIRSAIYDIIGEMLAIGSVENHQGNFIVQNLLNYFQVMLIQVLLDNELFKILVELSGVEDQQISLPAQKYLKELTQLMFNLLPNCNKYIDFLIASANQNDNQLVDLKAWSSYIVNTMGNYVFDGIEKKKLTPSRFLYQCENLYLATQLGLPSHRINMETIEQIKMQIEGEADDTKFASLIKNSMVLTHKDEPSKWIWESVLEIIETFLQNNDERFQEVMKNKFLKRILHYFCPYSMQFIVQDWKPENFIQAKVGYLTIQLLLKHKQGRKMLSEQSESFLELNRSYLQDLSYLLKSIVPTITMQPGSNQQQQQQPQINQQDSQQQSHQAMYLMTPENFSGKMIREYISWIGVFSMTTQGLELLDKFKIFDTLFKLVDKKGKFDHILIFLLFCLDYGRNGKCRDFLQYCLENGSNNLVKTGLELLRLLYRSELTDFQEWGVDLLVTRLYMEDDILIKAVNVIQEVTQDDKTMAVFIQRKPKLDALIKAGSSSYLITLLANRSGFKYLYSYYGDDTANNWTLKELEKWKNKENKEYVDKVEKCLMNALNYVGQEDNTNYYRFPDLLNNPDNSFATLGFIHRMPWIMMVYFDFEREDNNQDDMNKVFHFQINIEYNSSQNSCFVLVGTPCSSIQQEFEKILIREDYQFIIKFYLQVGKKCIDLSCKDQAEPYYNRCDFNDKRHLAVFRNGKFYIEKNGITYVFDKVNDKIRLSCIKVMFKMGENQSNQQKIPPHIFGELVKTSKGMALLQQTKYLDEFIEDIRKEETELLMKRASLWAIGHIGSTEAGIEQIIQKGFIQDLVKMAETQEYLSLRGTCLYIINMLCNMQKGRQELERLNWLSHWNSNLGWICIPKNINQFFYITREEDKSNFWGLQNQYWQKYDLLKASLNLNEDQQKLLEYIALLANSLTFKNSIKEIKKIMKQKPDLFKDKAVFNCIMLMMVFYKFRFDARKLIYSYFEKIITSQGVFTIIESNSLNMNLTVQ